MTRKLWYACMKDNDDTDWGTGFDDLEKAVDYVRDRKDIYPDGYVAVIDVSADPVCVEEIRDI